jgi:hypothetical protein
MTPARHVRAAAGACSSSKPSNAGASPALRHTTLHRPGPPRHDPAWPQYIPPRSPCASGNGAARAGDVTCRANVHPVPQLRAQSMQNATHGRCPACQRRGPERPRRPPLTKAKPENPIGYRSRPAASCFGGNRTPAGARFPSHVRPFTSPSSLLKSSRPFMWISMELR